MASSDYISREAVISSLNRLCDRVCQYSKAQRKVMCGACPLGDAFTVIEDAIPAADVRPVRRGKWNNFFGDVPGTTNFTVSLPQCSECGFVFNWDWDSPYCSNCGADMRPTLMPVAKEES